MKASEEIILSVVDQQEERIPLRFGQRLLLLVPPHPLQQLRSGFELLLNVGLFKLPELPSQDLDTFHLRPKTQEVVATMPTPQPTDQEKCPYGKPTDPTQLSVGLPGYLLLPVISYGSKSGPHLLALDRVGILSGQSLIGFLLFFHAIFLI